jgi:hypothetical protein
MPSRIANLCRRARSNSSEKATSNDAVRHSHWVGSGVPDGGATNAGAVVAMVTIAVTGVTPSLGVSEVGATVHVELIGAPVQASATA